ncbi:MAG: hypothetical protein ABI051_09225 [Vicinamibacterales bacterium]
MTARIAAAIVSSCVAVGLAGCTGFYEIPVETPVQAKIDVSSFQRVLVAGFLGGGSRSIDANTETARLLRSQLRGKQDLRVIDADAISLAEEVDKRLGREKPEASPSAADLDPRIRDEKDLAAYEAIFSDAAYWKKVGEEYQSPLIVTGSVLFTEVAKSGVVSRPQSFVNDQGQEQYRTVRTYSDMKGYAVSSKFVFIDGRTGAQLHSESYHEETLYPSAQNTPALSSYFELMDKVLPSFLNTLSTQKIRGSRILLR